RRNLGAGSVLLCNFSPHPKESDIAKQEVFPPLMHELIRGIAGRESERRDPSPGTVASTTIPTPVGKVTAMDPEGRSVQATVDSSTGGVILEKPEVPGVYRIESDGREAALLAINP